MDISSTFTIIWRTEPGSDRKIIWNVNIRGVKQCELVKNELVKKAGPHDWRVPTQIQKRINKILMQERQALSQKFGSSLLIRFTVQKLWEDKYNIEDYILVQPIPCDNNGTTFNHLNSLPSRVFSKSHISSILKRMVKENVTRTTQLDTFIFWNN